MARPQYTKSISADDTSQMFYFSRGVVATTVYMQVTSGGGSGAVNTLTVTFQGCPNPTDSDAAKVFITDEDTSSFPPIIFSSDDLPDTKLISYQMNGAGRFNLDYAGGGSHIFNVNIWTDP